MKPMRVLAVSLIVVGLGLSAYAAAFFSGASIPYQDPTPELLVQQANDLRNAGILFAVGLAAALAGGVALWRSRARDRERAMG